MRMRLFPILTVVGGLALLGKLGGFWFETGALAQSQENQAANTDAGGDGTAGAAAETVDSANGGSTNEGSSKDPAEAASADGSASGEENVGLDDAVPGFQKAPLSADPFDLSDEEIDLLQALAKRRGELEQRERDIDQREAMLAAAESRIETRVSELEELGRQIQALLEEHDAKNAEQILSLVRIYESMKPKEAARIFETLEMKVVLDVIGQMQERKSATILAKMDPRIAQAITLQLAQRNALPLPRE